MFYMIEEIDPQTYHRYNTILTAILSVPRPRRSVRDFVKGFGDLLPSMVVARKARPKNQSVGLCCRV